MRIIATSNGTRGQTAAAWHQKQRWTAGRDPLTAGKDRWHRRKIRRPDPRIRTTRRGGSRKPQAREWS